MTNANGNRVKRIEDRLRPKRPPAPPEIREVAPNVTEIVSEGTAGTYRRRYGLPLEVVKRLQ